MPTAEEFAALQKALAQATQTSESLAGELRITRAERDLLKEQLNKFKRQLFAAKSEASAGHQKDMFFNEAEALGSATQPAQEETEADDNTVEVPAHKRTKRGRKPLDPALPREVAVAAVANFPHGALDEAGALADVRAIADAGGDEVDLVLPWRAMLGGQAKEAARLVGVVRAACSGQRLKLIGTEARLDMVKLFESKIMLSLWVKVKGGWSDDERALKSLGYGDL